MGKGVRLANISIRDVFSGVDRYHGEAKMVGKFMIALIGAVVMVGSCMAEQPQDFLTEFAVQAKKENPQFSGFDSGRGKAFFTVRHGGDWMCASCHTENPGNEGKHIVTGKTIKPMSPAVNHLRFTETARVEKWFKRNCKDVLLRECTAQEKGDVVAYVLSPMP